MLQPAGIAGHHGRASLVGAVDVDVAGVGGRAHRFDGRVHHRPGRQRRHFQLHLAGGDAAHVQQVLDQLGLGAGVAFYGLQAAVHIGLVAAAAPQYLRPAEDGGQRRAQFVRQRGQEFVFHLAGALGLGARAALAVEQYLAFLGRLLGRLVQARIVDRHRRLRRHAADNALGALAEHMRLRMAEEQRADHFPRARDHRHRQIAAHRRMALGRAGVGCVQGVAGVAQQVVAAHDAVAAHAGAEQCGGARLAVAGKRGRRAARQRVQHQRVAARAGAVMEKGAETRAADAGSCVGHFL